MTDRNGPWLAERLRDLGVDLETIVVVGDRPDDMESALAWLAREGVDLIVTSGGLGPTADDLTAAVVGRFQGREPVLDEPLRGRIAAILEGIVKRWPNIDLEALEEGNRKQATIPLGATILEPVGTAPGLVVPPAEGRSGPVGRRAARAAERAAADVGRGGRDRCAAARDRRAHGDPAGDAAPVRDPGVGDRRDAAARAGRRRRPRARSRSRPACGAARSRS